MSINNKTILILTAQFGAGHISAAKARIIFLKNTVIQIYLLKIL